MIVHDILESKQLCKLDEANNLFIIYEKTFHRDIDHYTNDSVKDENSCIEECIKILKGDPSSGSVKVLNCHVLGEDERDM